MQVEQVSYATHHISPYELVIELRELTSLAYINLVYKTRAIITVSVSKNRTGKWIVVEKDFILTHTRERRISIGSLPCKYLKIQFHQGDLRSLEDLAVYGLEIAKAQQSLDPDDFQLLLNEPYKIIYQ
ncbi:unnamed protein product [Blepharisma stoltei]|uniref:Uncharacterized protein n=1 Tax=Blepharisma stoltei TaxID=1481888 RepID=A0AAU9ISW8_9CILI|nr:unnamed protein product [Blepharisma stoltei]